MTNKAPLQRLMERVSPEPTSGCWLWTGATRRRDENYGCMSIGNVTVPAHRASWMVHRGPIAPGLAVCHRCDNPGCVNPDHLFLGTSADNQLDMVAKGRSASGERNGRAKLTEANVAEIRRAPAGANRSAIARRFGVSETLVRFIQANQAWRSALAKREG